MEQKKLKSEKIAELADIQQNGARRAILIVLVSLGLLIILVAFASGAVPIKVLRVNTAQQYCEGQCYLTAEKCDMDCDKSGKGIMCYEDCDNMYFECADACALGFHNE
jgi:hypothetical protein